MGRSGRLGGIARVLPLILGPETLDAKLVPPGALATLNREGGEGERDREIDFCKNRFSLRQTLAEGVPPQF